MVCWINNVKELLKRPTLHGQERGNGVMKGNHRLDINLYWVCAVWHEHIKLGIAECECLEFH